MIMNQSIDRYDFDSLEAIYEASRDLQARAERLAEVGQMLRAEIDSYLDEFTSINYERIKEASERYLATSRRLEEESSELARSCKQLAEKFGMIFK